MKLVSYFKHFLENTVNLNQSRIDQLEERLQAIEKFISEHPDLGQLTIELIPQGSYAHKTIIKPVNGHEFDADVLLYVHEQPDWEPKDYIANLYAAFCGSATYKEMVRRRTRCVVIDYANEFHIDIVPYLERSGAHYITNRHKNRFELTNPEGFNEWLDARNRDASNHLVEVIRLVKYLRDSKGTFSIKSVILTTLLGGHVNQAHLLGDLNYYADMPTTLLRVITSLDAYLQANPVMPTIADPSGTGENFSDRWDQDGYSNFRDKIHYYAAKIDAACHESDKATCIKLWQDVFGEDFAEPPATQTKPKLASLDYIPPTEQFLDRDFNITTTPTRHNVRIVGRIAKKAGFRHGLLSSRGNKVGKGRELRFSIAHCDVPEPYDVYWKVRNSGEEANQVDQLRGEITKDTGNRTRTESTKYHGSHYVECYVVKDGTCVASDRQLVYVK